MLAVLKDEIAPIEARVEALIASDADLSQKAALLPTAVGVGRVVAYGLVAALPELNPVERVFCEVRRCVEGVVYGSLEAKLAAVEGAVGGLREGMVRLVGWDWIREALEGLPCD